MSTLLPVAILALLSPVASATWADTPGGHVPARFLGTWAADADLCGQEPYESMLEITPDSIAFYASGGPIRSVEAHSVEEVTLVAELHGESDETWAESMTLRLSQAGNRLAIDDREGFRHRCPPANR
ncbi:MAG: hypothetical protein KF823_12460 [Xanthomonadales bacterium]|nr:hypothetical protein [Xanthomonadales bacterium]